MARRVVFVVFPALQVLDLTGPVEVFSMANRLLDREEYTTVVASADPGPVMATCGLAITPGATLRSVRGPMDTVVVVGGLGAGSAALDPRYAAWLRRAAVRTRRLSSVCTGAFLLAEAGVLDGRRATTHWASCGALAERYPAVDVAADPIFVRDGDVWTSAGVTAGIDLALALVEDDLGSEIARQIARWLVVFVQRPGGQAQFSVQLDAQRPQRSALREIEAWLADHLDADLSVAALAERAGMSTRNFARAFRAEVGTTPATHVESLRVEAARRLLETTDRPLKQIARACGFGTVETMHRSFKRVLQVSPGDYRRHFRSPQSA